MRAIMGLFGRSPFGPLAEHTERVHETVLLIRPLFMAFLARDWDKTQEIYEQICELERQADDIKNEIRDHLPKSLFLPVDRADMLLFLKEQDALADSTEDLGVMLTMRRTEVTDDMKEPILGFVDQVIRTSQLWYETVKTLPALQETSFGGREVGGTIRSIIEISDLEREADELQAAVTKMLFEREEELGAVSVFFWMRIFKTLGSVANHAENSADLLRLMLARR
jgi:uncharacterized protein